MATEILQINELSAAVATKFPTFNEGLRQREAQNTRVLSRAVSDPATVTPEPGDVWIVAAGGVDEWAGQDDNLAHWWNGRWDFHVPFEGLRAAVLDEQTQVVVWDGSAWVLDTLATPAAVSVSSVGGILTLNIGEADAFPYFHTVLFENVTDVVVTGGQPGGRPTTFWLEVESDGVSSIAWPSAFLWSGGTPPPQSLTAGNVDLYRCYSWNGWNDIVSHQAVADA